MTTTLGKFLVFANLVLGVGAATVGTTLYGQRPGWFDPPAEGGFDKGHAPVTFKGLAADIDAAGKAAQAAAAAWAAETNRLTAAEQARAARQLKMFGRTAADGKRQPGLLDFARDGDPAFGGAGFFNLKADPATKLLDLDRRPDAKGKDGGLVIGPDGLPLRGADTLLERFNVDSQAIIDLAAQDKKLRLLQRQLGAEVGAQEVRVLAQRVIRQNLLDEAAYLDDLRVNAAGDLDAVAARAAQLRRRLALFGGTKD